MRCAGIPLPASVPGADFRADVDVTVEDVPAESLAGSARGGGVRRVGRARIPVRGRGLRPAAV